MANHKSWRRSSGPPSARGPSSRLSHKPLSTPFAGISSASLSAVLHLLVSKDVVLATVDGAHHTGLFAGSENAPDGLRLVLNYARSTPPHKGKPLGSFVEKRGQVARKFSVSVNHVLSLSAAGVMEAATKADSVAAAAPPTTAKTAFATDAEISRGTGSVGRELKPFDDFTDIRTGQGALPSTTLDEQTFGDIANGRSGKKWDQFQANEDKFGVKTSFDEDQYTTKIDTRDANFAKREREATRLASEIEAKQSDNIHVRIERNQKIGQDLDEETLHSGVQRPTAPKQPERPASKSALKSAPKPAPKPADTAKVTKPALAVERPKLSYAAAAAGSVKAQPTPPAAKPTTKAATKHAAKSQGSGANRIAPSAQSTSTSNTQTSSSEKKNRDVVPDKKSKTNGARGNREKQHPQLAKVRATITGRNSPSQSRNSPLPTPATADTSAVAVLNLDAQTPNLGPEHIKCFEEYKTNRAIGSIAENRIKITDDLKKFSTQLDSRNGPLRRSSSTANTNSTNNSTSTAEKKINGSNARTDEKASVAVKAAEAKVAEVKVAEAKVTAAKVAAAKATEAKIAEAKAETGKEVKPTPTSGKTQEATQKPKTKIKLNPNAMEFKYNPEAPKFEPSAQKQPPMNHPPQTFTPYPIGGVPPEYAQPPQPGHQGYAVPMQAMGQIPYGQPYGMIMPGGVPAGIAGGNSAYQFIQGPPGAFPGAQVAGRFAQNGGMPVSYGYPQMNPNIPMVMAQTPQRIPAGPPFSYYNSGPYPGGQVPGGPQMPQPPQQQMYAPANQQGGVPHQQGTVPHMQGGGMHMGGRGGHSRRGGGGRRGGKHHGQHSHTISTNGQINNNNGDKGAPRTTENGMTGDMGQR